MIVIMSLKQFEEKKKKLVEAKDYYIIDATEQNGNLHKYVNTITMDKLAVSAKAARLRKETMKNDLTDPYKLEALEDKIFKSPAFIAAMMGCMKTQLEKKNCFIVLQNIVYKMYKKRYVKEFRKLFGDECGNFICTFKEYEEDKKLLKVEPSPQELREMNRKLNSLEQEVKNLEKKRDREILKKEEEKAKKKAKKKKEEKDKKKKKKKKSSFDLF